MPKSPASVDGESGGRAARRRFRAAAALLTAQLLGACGGGGGAASQPPAPNGTAAAGNTAPGAPAEFTLHDVQVSPYAIWADELPTRAITVEARATGVDVALAVSYFDGLVGGTGAHLTRAMFDDGTHGDAVAADDVWTLSFVLDVTEPSLMRLYDGTVDAISLSIAASDGHQDPVSPANAIDAHVDIAVMSRELDDAFPAHMLDAKMMITDTMVNIVDPGFDEASLASVTERLYEAFPADPFDFAVVFHTRTTGDGVPRSIGVKNDTAGINLGVYDYSAAWGSAGRLQQVVFQNAHTIGLEINHELGHRWGAFLDNPALNLSIPTGFHWGVSDHVGQMGNGPYLLDDGQGGFLVTNADNSEKYIANPFSALELYLMGLVPAEEVTPLRFVTDPSVEVAFGATLPASSTRVVTIDDIVDVYGTRVPSSTVSQNAFTAAFIVVSDRLLTEAEYTLTSTVARYAGGTSPGGARTGGLFEVLDPPSFGASTGFRATLDTQLP